jgi:lauroyl/myristoyl acyltransferase
MRTSFKSACGLLFFDFIRALERVLPVRGLYLVLKPYAFARAWLNTAFKPPSTAPLPDFLSASRTRRAARQARMNGYLNRLLDFFPERLAADKWKNHCRIGGLAHWERAKQNGRPVVLAFCHSQNYFLLRTWPRAAGIPVAALEGGESENRSRLKKLGDRMRLFPEIPNAFQLDQLREAGQFLAAGNVLMVALDHAAGKQVRVPFCDGWNFQMATGAVRLAARHQAELIPACIIDEGGWRFRIELGRPVPAELLAAKDGWSRAGKHLLDEMRPHFQDHPEQCSKKMLGCLERNSAA